MTGLFHFFRPESIGKFVVNLIDSFMSHFTDTYEIRSKITERDLYFFFLSEGKKNIIKVVLYYYVMDLQDCPLYNVSLSDYDISTNSCCVDKTSDNGDIYRVFHTVLATIPCFFSIWQNAMLMVQGSDSIQEFQDDCRLTCKKRCQLTECRNAHRRINIYRNYVNKNFEDLTKEYIFYGSYLIIENQLFKEEYDKEKNYPVILLKKRKFDNHDT
jgi:hypothetical protein